MMQRHHAAVHALGKGNTFVQQGLSRIGETCFLYKNKHCPDARITTPSFAFTHMTTNTTHKNQVYWERLAAADDDAGDGEGSTGAGEGLTGRGCLVEPNL